MRDPNSVGNVLMTAGIWVGLYAVTRVLMHLEDRRHRRNVIDLEMHRMRRDGRVSL